MSAPIVHGGGVTAAAAVHGGQPQDWLDLSTGINPCPVALPFIDAAAWHRLPDQHRVQAARDAAAAYYGSTGIRPLPVPGTQSVIQLLPRLADSALRVAILSPTYGEYARAFERAGLAVDAITDLSAVGAQHGLVVVVNPNNPTGQVHSPAELAELWRRLAAQGSLLVVDEAFGDSTPETSLAGQAAAMPGLILFRSFGKFFGLAGLRLGFVIAQPDVLARFEDWLGPWAVSGPALAIAQALMDADTTPIRTAIAARHAGLSAVLDGAGLEVAGGTSLFSLVAHPRAAELHAHLCRRHILVRKFDYQPQWLRFGLATDAAGDARLAMALAQMDV